MANAEATSMFGFPGNVASVAAKTVHIIAPAETLKLDTRWNRQHTSSAEDPGPMRSASGAPKSKRVDKVWMISFAWTLKSVGSQKNEDNRGQSVQSPGSIDSCLRISRV